MSCSKRAAKLKKVKKNRKLPLYALKDVGLATELTSTLQRVPIVVATHNCDISSRSEVHSPGYAPRIPPYKPPPFTPILDHSPCLQRQRGREAETEKQRDRDRQREREKAQDPTLWMASKLHAPYHWRERGATQIEDKLVHVEGAADTCGHGGSYVVNCQREQ